MSKFEFKDPQTFEQAVLENLKKPKFKLTKGKIELILVELFNFLIKIFF